MTPGWPGASLTPRRPTPGPAGAEAAEAAKKARVGDEYARPRLQMGNPCEIGAAVAGLQPLIVCGVPEAMLAPAPPHEASRKQPVASPRNQDRKHL
jgi:hypothetical protein